MIAEVSVVSGQNHFEKIYDLKINSKLRISIPISGRNLCLGHAGSPFFFLRCRSTLLTHDAQLIPVTWNCAF